MIFPRCLIISATPTDFKKIPIEKLQPTLQSLFTEAPKDKYVMMDIGQGWLVINSFFFNSIHLKLAESEAQIKIVEPILLNPEKISWYQEKSLVLFGIPIIFSTGLILGLLSK